MALESRTELRTLNDFNFARFDAKVERRFAEQDARFERRLRELDVKIARMDADRRFAEQDATWDRLCTEMGSRLIRWMFVFWATWMMSEAGLFYLVLQPK